MSSKSKTGANKVSEPAKPSASRKTVTGAQKPETPSKPEAPAANKPSKTKAKPGQVVPSSTHLPQVTKVQAQVQSAPDPRPTLIAPTSASIATLAEAVGALTATKEVTPVKPKEEMTFPAPTFTNKQYATIDDAFGPERKIQNILNELAEDYDWHWPPSKANEDEDSGSNASTVSSSSSSVGIFIRFL